MIITALLLVLAIASGESDETNKWESIGCYESQDWTLFLKHVVEVEGKMTVEACARACIERHYGIFGLRDGSKCRCDDELEKAVKQPDDRLCQTQCVEDASQKCGSGNIVHVYQFPHEAEFNWAAWSAWSACSVTCGPNGNQKRTRQCVNDEKEPKDSILCLGYIASENQSCNTNQPCPEFNWAAWSAWSACSVTCGPNGNLKRTRQCMSITGTQKKPTNSTLCPGNIASENQSCNATKPCPVARFKWAAWSAWSACSVTCGPNGNLKRTRQCMKITGTQKKPTNSTLCRGNIDSENKSCNATKSCPAELEWTDWSAWGPCSKTCGPNGQQKRTRQCQRVTGSRKEAANPTECAKGGKNDTENQSCNTAKPCPMFKCKTVSYVRKACSATCYSKGKKNQTGQCQKIPGRKLADASTTVCAGGPGVKDQRCNATTTCCKTKGHLTNSDCCGKPCIGRTGCLKTSCPKVKERSRVCNTLGVRRVKQ